MTTAAPVDDVVWFCERALDGMAAIVTGLGDDLANRAPGLPGANAPYALLVHCLGVTDFWAGALVAGRTVVRDRDAEFGARGPVAGVPARVEAAKAQLRADAASCVVGAPLRQAPPASFQGPDRPLDQAAALVHVMEELVQHHGQMQILRDVLLATADAP